MAAPNVDAIVEANPDPAPIPDPNPNVTAIVEGSSDHVKVIALLQECGRLWDKGANPATLGRTKTKKNPSPEDFDYFLEE